MRSRVPECEELHPTDKNLSVGAPELHPTDKNLSVGAPELHPTDKDLSAGTPGPGAPGNRCYPKGNFRIAGDE